MGLIRVHRGEAHATGVCGLLRAVLGEIALLIYDPYINRIYGSPAVGIVKISEAMHENLRLASGALSRSINAQAEHWLRVGMLAELHPDLSYGEICQLLIQAEQKAADDVGLSAPHMEKSA